VKAQYNKG